MARVRSGWTMLTAEEQRPGSLTVMQMDLEIMTVCMPMMLECHALELLVFKGLSDFEEAPTPQDA